MSEHVYDEFGQRTPPQRILNQTITMPLKCKFHFYLKVFTKVLR